MTVPLLRVWTRAVVVPAWRRAAAVWVGAGIVGGIVFGPTGMHPRDLTRLAIAVPAVGVALAITWLLVFVPAARLLVRAEGARFLRSLPGPRWSPIAIAVVAIVVLQLPWVALWVAGDGARGIAIVVGWTAVIASVAAWRPRVRSGRVPRWRGGGRALAGVYARAVRRRASDAIVRGVGMAVLGGMAAALVVRNNGLAGREAAALGAGTITILLVPGTVGVLLPIVDAQRQSAWLARTLGISPAKRTAVLAGVIAAVYAVAAIVALGAVAFAIVVVLPALSTEGVGDAVRAGIAVDAARAHAGATLAWIGGTSVVSAIGAALITTRAVIRAGDGERVVDAELSRDERDERGAAIRVVAGALVGAAIAVVALGWFGVAGAGAALALGACAVLTARSR